MLEFATNHPVNPPDGKDFLAQHSAVVNPYALAEVMLGRKINWHNVDARRILEEVLHTPYEELFDPKFEGPLYFGFQLDEQKRLQPAALSLFDMEIRVDLNDLDLPLPPSGIQIDTLGDLGQYYNTKSVADIAVQSAQVIDQRQLILRLRMPEKYRIQELVRVFPKQILEIFVQNYARPKLVDFLPALLAWQDKGRFFNEVAEFSDPIQGAVANCYFIAALSAVAWANPGTVRHLTRATGANQEQFVNMIRFYQPDSGGAIDQEIEVTDRLLTDGSGNLTYARSSEDGEIWPGIYEKAYAKLLTNTNNDYPDILATGWGDCVWATAQLTGGRRYYYGTRDHSADDLWDLVRQNSLSYRTFNPMTAWTYSSGDAAEQKVVYADANIVASHCYTVLGWAYRDGQKYIVLRNPWGNTEAAGAVLTGNIVFYDISWWRPINLATVDGVFALEANAFKTYFAGLGVVKP